MEAAQNCFFRDQLRSARATALADAEGFHVVLRVLELIGLIGQQLSKKIRGLSYYKPMLSGLASVSPLAADLPSQWPGYHTAFDALYDEMRQARNDAVHQGAYARPLTDHAVELSIILEDALMTEASKCSQFMVRNVIDAKPWHPVSYVRQQMLTHAFSYLSIWHHDTWKLIPEYSVARLLRGASSDALRGRHLIAHVSDAIEKSNLELLDAPVVPPEMPLARVQHSHPDGFEFEMSAPITKLEGCDGRYFMPAGSLEAMPNTRSVRSRPMAFLEAKPDEDR